VLQQLHIKNIALIDELTINFDNGFNVLTGETGAGKSIIIDSINAVLGVRFSKDLIRTGTDKSSVEALFQVENETFDNVLAELGIEAEDDGSLILSRDSLRSGRNSCRINSRLSTVSNLKDLGDKLIDFHGQHDNQSLLHTGSHINLLDAFGGNTINEIKSQYTSLLIEYKKIKDKLDSLVTNETEKEKRIDFLKFQIDEIKRVGLKEGEEEELVSRRLVLSNAENIIRVLSESYELLFSGETSGFSALDKLNATVQSFSKIEDFGDSYKKISTKLEEISFHLHDITDEIRREIALIDFEPQELEKVEERLDVISRLKRKHGNSIKEILELCITKEVELEELTLSSEKIEDLRKGLIDSQQRLYKSAEILNKERMHVAKVLEQKIGNELHELEMKKAQFKVDIEFNAQRNETGGYRFSGDGLDKVEFMFSPNVGEPLKPLSKIASGGEMSRIMLAIKTILADVDDIPILIFDEIDSGVSGRVAQKVGEKMAMLSKKHQVICITHLPQIACMADNHFFVEKTSDGNMTKVNVKELSKDERKGALAKLLGGIHISDISLLHAEEMLQYAFEFKKSHSLLK